MSQSIQALVGRIRSEDASDAERRRTAARMMTIIEDEPFRIVELIQAVITEEDAHSKLVVGVTGPSGSGKSTLTDAVVSEFRKRNSNGCVGVVAVDPSSPFTGGAILGDRIRMMKHTTDPGVFIRSLASRGHLGGLSLGTSGVSRVMQLIGCDPLIIETVGVGQNEVEILELADLVVVVQSPGAGDSTQMLKAGLLEIGDVFVVNKSDLPGAEDVHSQLRSMIELRRECGSGREPVLAVPICAHTGKGVAELVDLLSRLAEENQSLWRERRAAQMRDEVRHVILETATGLLREGVDEQTLVRRVLEQGEALEEVSRDLVARAAEEIKRHHGS
ncbi:MAG: methylmalonyl Co-A mutase-associated GTPase MeaB [Verrucomicrobia bacterium]|nr:methylmalonyl Co-A mutase-associated GTPase MeaB [Verrucomicrobiota bacterium]